MALPSGAVSILDFTTLVGSDGTLISSVTDTVGGGPGATAAGSSRPTLGTNSAGQRYLQFDGIQNLLTVPTITVNAQSFTVIAVIANDDIWQNNRAYVRGFRSDGPSPMYYSHGGRFYFDSDAGAAVSKPVLVQSPIQDGDVSIIGYGSSASISTWLGNDTVADGTATGISAGATWVGFKIGNEPAFTQGFKGKYYQFYYWPRLLTHQEFLDASTFMRASFAYRSASWVKNKTRFVINGDSIAYGASPSTVGNTWIELATAAASIATKQIITVATGTRITSQTESLLSTEMLLHLPTTSPYNVAWFEIGSNDLTSGIGGLSAAQFFAAVKSLCATFRGLRPGVPILWETVLPRESDATFETRRQAANVLLMVGTTNVEGLFYSRDPSDGGPDYILDVGSDPSIGAPGSQNGANYNSDHIHMSDAGGVIKGNLAKIAMQHLYQEDLVAPVVASASIDTTGLVLTVNFTEATSPPVLPASGITGFALTGGHTLTSGTRTTNTQATFPITPVVNQGDVVTLSATSSNLTDTATNPLADFTLQAVTNNSTVAGSSGSIQGQNDHVPLVLNLDLSTF